jgi:uncharacterized protein (TIGR00295 family)
MAPLSLTWPVLFDTLISLFLKEVRGISEAVGAKEISRAWDLLERSALEYKPEWKDSIIEHARIVRDTSLFLAGLHGGKDRIDFRVLELGAILHDVGRSRAERTVVHGIAGGKIIRQEGFGEGVARVAERHMGVGITRSEAASLGLPEHDFIPETLEEQIVCYTDNLLYYFADGRRHELRDSEAVVKRFTEELGEAYGDRVRAFMTAMEKEIGTEGMARFRQYVSKVNKGLNQGNG